MARPLPTRPLLKRPAVVVPVLLGALVLVWGVWDAGGFSFMTDAAALAAKIRAHGALGPAVAVLLIAIAIIFSPVPSAPVGVAAGAVFGHYWGWAYVVAGSCLGASVAFAIARALGRDALARWFGEKVKDDGPMRWAASPWALMGLVFVSRLVPFVSFDLVSYLAGLTPIRFWQFFVATVAGIAPISFALAHVGEAAMAYDAGRVLMAVLLLGLLTGAPVLAKLAWDRWHRGQPGGRPGGRPGGQDGA